jgi:hypothetical protein
MGGVRVESGCFTSKNKILLRGEFSKMDYDISIQKR